MTDLDIWGQCWQCGHETPHERIQHDFYPRTVELFAKKPDGRVDHRAWVVMGAAYQFVRCRKCAALSLFVDEYPSAISDATDSQEFLRFRNLINSTGKADGFEIRRHQYPDFGVAPFPEWTHDLEETEMVLFWEIYSAISVGLLSLAMMGIRTLVDRFANRTVGDIGGFEKKLDTMLTDGHINKTQREQLQVVIYAGHAASHRGIRYEKKHLDTALKIVESLLLHDRYKDAVDALRGATPPRTKT